MLRHTWILLGFVHAALGVGDPCDPVIYNELDDPRRSTGYVTTTEDPLCDIHLKQGWYRFTSKAGSMMADSCQDRLRCGTVVPIWMNGTHPSVLDGVVHRQVCGNFENVGSYQSDHHCCQMSSQIAVKNCGSFYVYFLLPPKGCPYSYCAGTATPCPAGKVSINGDGMPPCSDGYPVMTETPVLSDPIISDDQKSFHFDCRIRHSHRDHGHKFRVTWTFDGHEDPNVPSVELPDGTSVVSLDGALLKDHINSNVGCQVQSYYDGNQHNMGPPMKSNNYYAGIQISPAVGGRLTVDERDWEKNITISSTIPILCDHNTRCCLLFKLDIDHTNGQDASIPHSCDWKLCSKHWNNKTNMATVQVPVVANKDMVNDGDHQLLLTFEKLQRIGGGNYTDIFTGHKPNPLPVEVIDAHSSVCNVHGDPHIHGFDFSTYHLYKVGDFTMCHVPDKSSEIGPFQVTIRTWACGRVACVCGVTIREHNDVIIINQCDQIRGNPHTSPTVEYPNGLRASTVVQRSRNGHLIVVYLPTGTEIKVHASTGNLGVVMTTSGVYHGMCKGICGTNDGEQTNEFTYPDGHIDPICTRGRCVPNNFLEGWRVPLNESMFENPVPTVVDTNDAVKYCQCRENLNNHPAVNCTLRGDVPNGFQSCNRCPLISPIPPPDLCDPVVNPLCGVGGWHVTKRRAAGYVGHDYNDVDPVDNPYHLQTPTREADFNQTWPSDNGMSRVQAHRVCTKAVQSAQLYLVCWKIQHLQRTFITDCIEDILMSGSKDFLGGVAEAFTAECQALLALEPSSYVTTPEGHNVMKHQYAEDVCLPGCEEHGNCTAGGFCQCEAGWEGELCHLVTGQGPQMDRVRSGPLCDTRQRPCETVYIDATNLDLSEDLACRVQLLDENGQSVGGAVDTAAHMLSAGRLACQVPKPAQANQRYAISATNDGNVFGNSIELQVFDSTCLNCEGGVCTQKTSTCHIGGLCYQNGQKNPEDPSQICDVTQSNGTWTVTVLPFLPTVSGPDSDHLVICSFTPPPGSTGDFQITWLLNSTPIDFVSDIVTLTNGNRIAGIPESQLPVAGELTCQVELNGAKASSNPVSI